MSDPSLISLQRRRAGQLAQLLCQEIARALQLREQAVERVELLRVARLQRDETLGQRFATLVDVVDRGLKPAVRLSNTPSASR